MSDTGFSARVGRIERGQQWAMDGIVKPRFQGRLRKRLPLAQQPSFRFAVIAAVAFCLTFAALDISSLPEPVQALLDPERIADTTAQARAMLASF